jgi:hypothetical protein
LKWKNKKLGKKQELSVLTRKKRKSGITTPIGGIIVIAVIFSVITPAFFYMASMNSLYDEVMDEMKDFDDQRSLESVFTWLWPNEIGNVTVNIENTGPYAIDIARLWVVPSNPLYDAQGFTPEPNHIGPKEVISLYDLAFNNYIASLVDTTYYIKIVTEKGNIFYTRPLAPSIIGDYYKYPLVILKSSVFNNPKSGDWELVLHVFNQGDVIFTVDYVVITSQYVGGGGQKLQIDICDDSTHPLTLPVEFEPQEITNTYIIDFSTHPNTNVLLVELIGSMRKTGTDEMVSGYILGAYYHYIEET